MIAQSSDITGSNPRFVVGSLVNLQQALRVIDGLFQSKLPRESIGILTQQYKPSCEAKRLSVVKDVLQAELESFTSCDDVVCIGGTFGGLLRDSLKEGSGTLRDVLQRWLLARHADNLCAVVENKGVLVLVEVHNPEEERAASLSLLRHSYSAVEIHDFSVR